MLISSSRKPRENPDHTQGERPEDRSARAAVASGFNNRNFFPHGSGGWKSKIRVSMGWLPSPPSSHGRSSVSVCALILFFQSTSHIGLGPPPMTSLNPKHLFRDPLSNQSHSALLGLRTPTCKSGEGGGHGSARNSEQTRRAGQNHCRSSSGAHAPHH